MEKLILGNDLFSRWSKSNLNRKFLYDLKFNIFKCGKFNNIDTIFKYFRNIF